MSIIKLADIKKGMIVAQPVIGHKGMELFCVGEVLNEKHIKTLQAWGITEIDIKSAFSKSPGIDIQSTDHLKQKAIKQANNLYQKNSRQDPVIEELFKITVNNIIHNGEM